MNLVRTLLSRDSVSAMHEWNPLLGVPRVCVRPIWGGLRKFALVWRGIDDSVKHTVNCHSSVLGGKWIRTLLRVHTFSLRQLRKFWRSFRLHLSSLCLSCANKTLSALLQAIWHRFFFWFFAPSLASNGGQHVGSWLHFELAFLFHRMVSKTGMVASLLEKLWVGVLD